MAKKGVTKKKCSIPESRLIPVTTLAYMFDRHQTMFREWANAGHIVKEGRGKYDGKSAFEYILNKDVSGDTGSGVIDDEDGMFAKALYEKSKADLAEVEIAIETQDLVLERDIDGYLINILTIFKRELLALSRVMPSYLYGLTMQESIEVLKKHLQRVYDEVLDRTDSHSFKLSLEE